MLRRLCPSPRLRLRLQRTPPSLACQPSHFKSNSTRSQNPSPAAIPRNAIPNTPPSPSPSPSPPPSPSPRMAGSKFEYVRLFERPDSLLPNTWIVVRIDGRGFHKFSTRHGFTKPNDQQALDLMNAAAVETVKELPDICIAYGVSDEFSFVLHRSTTLFERRESKLVTTITSSFTSWYVYLWPQYFPKTPLCPPLPTFDGRAVCYPADENLRDYMSWRQADCHINNLYNTTFWALVQQGGMSTQEAEDALKGTFAKDKNEILFSKFKINYNNEPEYFRKGSVVFRDYQDLPEGRRQPQESTAFPKSKTQFEKEKKRAKKTKVAIEHVDIIQDGFWAKRPWILGNR